MGSLEKALGQASECSRNQSLNATANEVVECQTFQDESTVHGPSRENWIPIFPDPTCARSSCTLITSATPWRASDTRAEDLLTAARRKGSLRGRWMNEMGPNPSKDSGAIRAKLTHSSQFEGRSASICSERYPLRAVAVKSLQVNRAPCRAPALCGRPNTGESDRDSQMLS